MISGTILQRDGADEFTMVVHDESGNELGSVVVTKVHAGVKFEAWNSNDTHVGELVAK